MKHLFEQYLKPIIVMLGIDPFLPIINNVPLDPTELTNAAYVIRYIASQFIAGCGESDIIQKLLDAGYTISHDGILYGVQCALKLGIIFDSQIPLDIYAELKMETFYLIAETGKELLKEIMRQQVIEDPFGLLKGLIDDGKELIKEFCKEHPVIAGALLAVVIGVVIISMIPSEKEVEKPLNIPLVNKSDIVSQVQDPLAVAVDNVGSGLYYVTLSTILGLTIFLSLLFFLYLYKFAQIRKYLEPLLTIRVTFRRSLRR